MHGRRACVAGGVHCRRHACQGGMCGRGLCVVGRDMHGRGAYVGHSTGMHSGCHSIYCRSHWVMFN